MKILLSLLFLLPLTVFAEHEATTTVQIHPGVIAINPLANPATNPGTLMTRNYMENEFETIKAPTTLRAALSLLQPEDAKQQAITKEAIAALRKKISTKPRRGTDFIQIIARADTKKEAVQLSHAVATAYMNLRREAEINRAKRALVALDQELLAQSDLVQAFRKELTVLIQQHGIPYFEDGQTSPLGRTEEQMIQNARKRLPEFKAMQKQFENQIEKLTKLKDEELVQYASNLEIPENTVLPHYSRYYEANKKKLALIANGLQPKHADVIALEKNAKKAMANALRESNSIKETLATKVEIIKRQIAKLQKIVTASEPEKISLEEKQKEYNQAKEAYEQSRAMLRDMKIKQQEARVLLKMPRDPITLHEKAR